MKVMSIRNEHQILRRFEMKQIDFPKTFLFVITAIVCGTAWAESVPKGKTNLDIESKFGRLASLSRKTKDYDNVVKKLEAFAREYPQHDLAAEAHLKIIDLLERKKDMKSAFEKTRWLAKNFPKAKKQQLILRGWAPSTMVEEWKVYVKEHPILMKDFAWYRLAELHVRAKRYDDALAAHNYILSTVKPDKLPDTKNELIVETFRLHKAAFEQKIALLKKMKKKDEAQQAAEDYEKLYPKAAWKKLGLDAAAAWKSYSDESKRLRDLKEEEERRRIEEEDKRNREEMEREEQEQKEREEELKKKREEERKEREAGQRTGRQR
jgi:hypothetical protein